MRRGLVLVLLVLSVFWQVIAVGGQTTAFGDAEESVHALMHWQEQSHHHHEDGTLAQDDSDESLQHVLADSCLSAAAVWATVSFGFAPVGATPPAMSGAVNLPSPPLDGLRRPPRLTA